MASDSYTRPQCVSLLLRSQIITHQDGLIFCASLACSATRRPLTFGQDLLNLQWLMVAIVLAQQRLSRQPKPSSPTSCTWGPSGWPYLLCLPSSSLLVLSRQPFLSCLCPPEASIYRVANSVGLTLVTGRHALPCPDHPQKPRRAFRSSQQAVWVTYAGSSPYVQIPFCAPRNHPFVPMSSAFLLHPSRPSGETHQDWGLGLTASGYNPKLPTLLWGVMGRSTQRHLCTPQQSWTQRGPL